MFTFTIKRGWRIGTQLIIAGEYFINCHKDEQNNYLCDKSCNFHGFKIDKLMLLHIK